MLTTAVVDFDTFSFKRVWWLLRRDILLINCHPLWVLVSVIAVSIGLYVSILHNDPVIFSFLLSIAWMSIAIFFTVSTEADYLMMRKNQVLTPASLTEKLIANLLSLALIIPLFLHLLCFVVAPILQPIFNVIFIAIFDVSLAADELAYEISFLSETITWNTVFSIGVREAFILLLYWLVILWFVNHQITVKPYSMVLKILLLLILMMVMLVASNALIMEERPIALSLFITFLFVTIIELTIMKQYSIIIKISVSLILLTVVWVIVNLTVTGERSDNLHLYIVLFFLATIIVWIITFFLVRIHYRHL